MKLAATHNKALLSQALPAAQVAPKLGVMHQRKANEEVNRTISRSV